MNIIKINDPADPRLEPYCDIRERDLITRNKRFIAEGKVVLNVLLQSRDFQAESVLILESRLAGMMATLASAEQHLPIYVADASVMNRTTGFSVHRGVLAIGKWRNDGPTPIMFGPDALVVVISGVSNHDNVGAIFRNAAAFQADAILLDEQSCDPLYRKALRVSVGAVLKVPFLRDGTLNRIADRLIAKSFMLAALSPSGSQNITNMPKSGKRALILGSEGHGLPQSLLERISAWSIPMANDFDSLNVATASGIALFHASAYSSVDA